MRVRSSKTEGFLTSSFFPQANTWWQYGATLKKAHHTARCYLARSYFLLHLLNQLPRALKWIKAGRFTMNSLLARRLGGKVGFDLPPSCTPPSSIPLVLPRAPGSHSAQR